MANRLKISSPIIFIIIVIIVAAYGIIVEQTSKSYVPVHQKYEQEMNQQTISYIQSLQAGQPTESLPGAYQLFTESKFNQAYQALLPWAIGFDNRAQLVLGFLNQYGLGTEKNEKDAAFWYFSAIRKNQYNEKPMARGIEYMYGLDGHEVNYEKAAEWFNMAAQLSDDRY